MIRLTKPLARAGRGWRHGVGGWPRRRRPAAGVMRRLSARVLPASRSAPRSAAAAASYASRGYYYGEPALWLLQRAGVRRQLRLCAAPQLLSGGDPSCYYAPNYAYPRSYRHGPAREDHLTGPARASSTKFGL